MRGVCITALAVLLAAPFVWLEVGLQATRSKELTAPRGRAPEQNAAAAYSWERIQRLAGSTRDAAAIALVGNPNRVVIAHRYGRLTVWDVASGVQTLAFPAGHGRFRAVAADAAGLLIAAATEHHVKVYETRTQRRLFRFPVVMTGVGSLALSADGAFLAATTKPHDVTVWDLADGTVALHISELTAAVSALSLSADGSRVAVARRDGGAAVWDVGAGKVIRTLAGHAAAVRSVDLPGDGLVLATGSADKTAKVWDVATGVVIATVSYATAPVTSVKLKNDGARLVVATGSGAIDLWSVETGTRIRRYGRRAQSRHRLAVSPDGSVVAAVGNACTLWAAGTGDELSSWRDRGHRVAGVQLSLGGARALALYVDGGSALYDVETAARLHTFASPPPPRREVPYVVPLGSAYQTVRLIGDGTRVLEVTPASSVRVRDVATNSVLRTFESDPAVQYPLILSPDHSLLLTGGYGNRVHIWNVASGRHLQTLAGHDGRVLFASFSANGGTVATGGTDGVVRLWSARTGECMSVVLQSDGPGAHSVSLSPDARYVLAWRVHHYVTSLNATALAETHLLEVDPPTEIPFPAGRWILGCAWRDDSKRLYTARHREAQRGERPASTGEIIQAWAPDGNADEAGAQHSSAWVRRAVYHPAAGTPIVLATSTFREFDVPRAGEMWPLDLLHRVYRLATSADGSTFAAVTEGGAIDIWRRMAGE